MSAAANSFPLLAAPFFIFSGLIMNSSGITERIFRFSDMLVGHIPGGIGHANVVGSMIFSGMSGSAIADAGGLGAIEMKAMKERGYDMKKCSDVSCYDCFGFWMDFEQGTGSPGSGSVFTFCCF